MQIGDTLNTKLYGLIILTDVLTLDVQGKACRMYVFIMPGCVDAFVRVPETELKFI